MTPPWLREFRRRLSARPAAPVRRPRARLRAEELEDRSTPATITWTGGAGDLKWETAGNWDLNRLPTSTDDAVIPDIGAAGPSLTVTLDSGTPTVRSITAAENLTLSGANTVLTLSGGTRTVSVGGTFTLDGGAIAGAVLASPTVGRTGRTTLDGVTLDAPLDLTQAGGVSVQLRGDIVLNSTVSVGAAANAGASAEVYLAADTSITTAAPAGTGAFVLGGGGSNTLFRGNFRTTIGPGVLVRGWKGGIGTGGPLVNRGTIRKDVGPADNGGTMSVNPGSGGRNEGVIETTVPGTLQVSNINNGPWTNAAGGTISASGGALVNIGLNTSVLATPDTWTNLGIISVAAGTRLDLYGQLTQAKIGTLVQDPTSLVNLAGGTLTGGLTLSDATGSYRLAGMTIQGGTYSVAPGSTAALLPTVNGGTLDGVTIDAPLDLSVVNNASVTLAGNVVLNSVVSIGSPAANGSYGQVRTLGDTAITTTAPAGTARFVFGSSGNNFLVQSRYSDALTIGPGVLIRGQTGGIGLGGGLRFTNRGTIRRDVAGGATLQVYFGGGGRNEGVIEATAPGLLALQGNAGVAWTNAAGATIAASGGATVDVGGDAPQTWTNQGTISAATAPGVSPTTVRFRGQLTRAGIGTVARDAGSVVQLFNGAVLTGGLALTTADGEWVLNGGTVQGGTVSATGAGKLVGASGILDGVTLNTPIDLTRTVAAALGVRNGLVLNAVVPVGSADGRTYAQVSPAAGAVITTAGGGGFVLGPNRSNAVYAPNGTVTVGPGVTVRAAGGTVGAGGAFLNSGAVTAAGGRVDLVLGPGGVNFGTIRVEAPAQARLIGGGWVNAPGGRIEVAGGAVDTAAGAADRWTNLGTIAATDLVLGPFQNYAPVVNLAGTFAQRDLGSFTRTPRTTVNLVGTLVGGLTLDDTLGSWNIAGGTLRGGRFAVAPGSGARLTATAVNNYLTQGVTLDAPIDLTGGGSPGLVVTGGLTLNATLAVGGAAGSGGGSVQFTGGTQELRTDGGGRVVFGASGGNSLTVTRGGTLTIGPGVVVEGEAGYVGLAAPGAADTIVNRGTIRATVPGPRAVTINPGVFQNLGTVRATNGARLNVQPATTNLNLSGPTVTVGSAKVVAATLAGGTWGADAGGRVWLFPTGLPISLNGPAPGDYAVIRVDRNAAAVVLDGPTSGFVNGSTAAAGLGLADPFAALAENLGPGSFTVRNNRPFTPAPAFVNRGDLTIGIGAANAPGGTSFRQLGGTLTVDGTFAPPGGTLTVEGGVVGGVGVIQGDVVNGGTVAPGASPGFLRVFGNYAQTAAGVLDLEVAGRDGNVPEYDRLQVTGDAVIAGTIRGTLADTFQPAPGDAFTVVTAKTLTLQGPRYELPAPGGSLRELAPVPAADKLTLVARRVPPIGFGYATTMGGPQAPAPDPATTRPNRVALDAAGNSYVTGVIGDGTTDLDREGPGGAQGDIPVGQGEVFLAKYDPAGRVVWVRTFGRSNDGPAGLAVAVDGRGNADPADDRVYVAGSQFGGFDVGGFIRRYRPDGTLEAVADLDGGSSGSSEVGGLAVGPTGNVVVAGRANEFVDLDPGPGAVFPPAGREFFVAEYTPALAYVRSAFLASTSAAPAGVAVDAAGDVWVGGTFGGALGGLGTGPLVSAGGGDAFLVKFRGSGGTFTDLLSRRYGDTDADSAAGVAVAPDGSVYLAGTFRRAVDFDPAADRAFTLISGGEGDVFVLKLAAEGAFRWARAVGGFRADAAGDVAVDPAGNVYLTGGFSDAVDFDPLDGTFLLSTAPGTAQQAFVAALDPAGQFRWAAQLGDRPGAVAAGRGVAADAAGRVASVGLFENTVDFDPTGGTALRSFTPPAPGAPAGYVSLLTQKAAPRVSIAGVPAGPVPQGATLALAAAVTDPDSTSFTYAWAVQRGTDAPLVGAGPVFGAVALRPGVYTVTLVVTDETGNSTTATARVSVTNAAPRLNPTSYASAAALPEPAPAAGAGVGSSLATGGGFTLAGAPGA
ncbi:MAG: PKD domain-containing protein, partial [Gemmataceae bacterium]|nr:PKD domain-containing protein [Gemmataceae bacterium]